MGPGSELRLDWGQYGGLKDALGDRRVYVQAEFTDDRGKTRKSWGILDIHSYEGTSTGTDSLREISKEVAKLKQGTGRYLRRIADQLTVLAKREGPSEDPE